MVNLNIILFSAASYEHGNEDSDSIKGEGFIDNLSCSQLLTKDSAPWG